MDVVPLLTSITFFLLAILAWYITYKRAEKFKNRKIIAAVVSFAILILMAVLSISELPGYVNVIFHWRDSVDRVWLYLFLFITAIYIEMIVITDDLIKNINILIPSFKK